MNDLRMRDGIPATPPACRPQRGAALVLAMLVAALAATVAVALAAEQQRWLADVGNRRDQVQAQSLALAGVQWARQILADDARSSTVDFLGEPWSYPLPPTPIANGSIEGRIEDAQGRLNLNNAALDGKAGDAERARLAQLFASKGIDPRMLGALAAAAPLLRTAEITTVRDARPQAWAALAPFVAALPGGTQVNVNTATPEVLSSIAPDLTGEKLAAFVAERARKPFTTMAELRERLPRGVTLPENTNLVFASNYFLVTVRSRQGESLAQARALLHRDGRAWPTVVWQTLE
ncbi:MAG: general secretion pathway protein GspK [Burkholderiales bacterium]